MFQRHSRAVIKEKQAKGKQAVHSLLHHFPLPDFGIESCLVRASHRSKSASTKYSWIGALSIIVHVLFSPPLRRCLQSNCFKCPLDSFWKRRDWPQKTLPFYAQKHFFFKAKKAHKWNKIWNDYHIMKEADSHCLEDTQSFEAASYVSVCSHPSAGLSCTTPGTESGLCVGSHK